MSSSDSHERFEICENHPQHTPDIDEWLYFVLFCCVTETVDLSISYRIASVTSRWFCTLFSIGETTLGFYSLSGKTSFHQISWSLEAAWLGIIIIAPRWNLTGSSAALLPRVKFQSDWKSKLESRDFTRSCRMASYRLVNRGPDVKRLIVYFNGYSTYRWYPAKKALPAMLTHGR